MRLSARLWDLETRPTPRTRAGAPSACIKEVWETIANPRDRDSDVHSAVFHEPDGVRVPAIDIHLEVQVATEGTARITCIGDHFP